MISLIIPTRNRSRTLSKVAPSFFSQQDVNEVIFVDDHGDDDSENVVREYSLGFPQKRLIYLRNEQRLGASMSRNIGVAAASNELILFCDDDEYLEEGYAAICRRKLEQSNAGAVSGRRVYMRPGESRADALRRFGNGLRTASPFNFLLCEYVNGAIFDGDIELPFTNAVILTRKEYLTRFGFDSFYSRGNGYREETDLQMNLRLAGHAILVTNDCHSIHLPMSEVRTGGQRVASFRRIYWSIYYTKYFYAKYYSGYAKLYRLPYSRGVALMAFSAFAIYRELIRPSLYPLASRLLSKRGKTVGAQV